MSLFSLSLASPAFNRVMWWFYHRKARVLRENVHVEHFNVIADDGCAKSLHSVGSPSHHARINRKQDIQCTAPARFGLMPQQFLQVRRLLGTERAQHLLAGGSTELRCHARPNFCLLEGGSTSLDVGGHHAPKIVQILYNLCVCLWPRPTPEVNIPRHLHSKRQCVHRCAERKV